MEDDLIDLAALNAKLLAGLSQRVRLRSYMPGSAYVDDGVRYITERHTCDPLPERHGYTVVRTLDPESEHRGPTYVTNANILRRYRLSPTDEEARVDARRHLLTYRDRVNRRATLGSRHSMVGSVVLPDHRVRHIASFLGKGTRHRKRGKKSRKSRKGRKCKK